MVWHHRPRAGFTLVFVVVVTAIITLLFAAVVTALETSADDANAVATMTIIQSVGSADSSFGVNVGHEPHWLHQLTTAITTSDSAVCLTTQFTSAQVTNWGNNTPFGLDYYINNSKEQVIYTPDGWLRDTLGINTTGGNHLILYLHGVSYNAAKILDVIKDGAQDSSTGTIRWSKGPVNDTLTVQWWQTVTRTC